MLSIADFWIKIDKTLRYHALRVVQNVRGVWWDMSPRRACRPVFIIGCSRAGTTMVYRTYSEAEELASLYRETHDFWATLHPLEDRNWESHALMAEEASQHDRDIVSRYFYSHTGSCRFVDKNNQNGLCVPYLHAMFPSAHFVYVKRSPGDNINSLIEGWRKPDQFAAWSYDLPETVAIDESRYTRWCFFLSDGWRKYLQSSIEEVCAFQYMAMNEAILEARKTVPTSQWTEICYEDLLQNPVEGFRQAFESAGLAFTKKLEDHCSKVLSNPYNAFSEIRLDKWRDGRNRERIESVLPKINDIAQRMGYEL
uniref:Sulfotransferase domain-containing protein n=2 Tax=Candidatus Methanogaster sp. ANME-2c ERB4 TaxID=2759911 RepID=A0A7G9YB92_9EURY|nr:hypothetical protein GHMBFEBI_00010 [Methanosarcinales archaeon ANME-2c ERB4]